MKTQMISTLLLGCFFALTGYSQNTNTDYKLREPVQSYISKKTPSLQFVMLAEVYNYDRRIAIVWPSVIDGQFIDNDIIGLVYQYINDEWVFKDEIGAFRGNGLSQIVTALGNEKFEIFKPDGLQIDSIPSFIHLKVNEIKNALILKKDNDAVKSIEALSQCFSINFCGYDNSFANFVIREFFLYKPIELKNIKIDSDKAEADVKIFNSESSVNGRIFFTKSGNGWSINDLIFN